MKLTEQQEKILEVLADECERNPETSLTGIDLKLLGGKVGAYQGIAVMYDVAKLQDLGFVIRNGNKVIITQKGLSYIGQQPYNSKSRRLVNSRNLLISLIIAIIAGLIVAIITGWHPL